MLMSKNLNSYDSLNVKTLRLFLRLGTEYYQFDEVIDKSIIERNEVEVLNKLFNNSHAEMSDTASYLTYLKNNLNDSIRKIDKICFDILQRGSNDIESLYSALEECVFCLDKEIDKRVLLKYYLKMSDLEKNNLDYNGSVTNERIKEIKESLK